LRLPHELLPLEPLVQKYIGSQFSRGRIEIDAKLQTSERVTSFTIDEDAAAAIYAQISAMQMRFGMTTPIAMGDVLSLPGVVRVDAPAMVELVALGERVIMDALADLKKARAREGALLSIALRDMLNHSVMLIRAIVEMASNDTHQRFRRFKERFADLVGHFGLHEDRLHQEFALLVERSDFTEEIDRLYAHARHFADLCQNHDGVGRKLDFLCQEMLRETNTLLSKGGDSQITIKAIDLKAHVERIREQVQNIE
jgi:uncharacterized protein (TIGR00255 family)